MSQAEAKRIPSLDGLRAISVGLVLAAHVITIEGFPGLRPKWSQFLGEKCGELGVKVFFVISGYLITSLLMTEIARTGKISLKDFYLRRTFRIFPAYYAYLLMVAVIAALGWVELGPGDLFAALTYTTNFHFQRANIVAHTWSLAVEEQFYLLWPLVMWWAGPKRRVKAVVAALVIAPFARALSYYIQIKIGSPNVGIGQTFPTVCDAIGTGCLLALIHDRLIAWRPYEGLIRSRAFALVPLSTLPVLAGTYVLWFDHTVAQSWLNFAICLCIDRVVRVPGGPIFRALNTRPLVWIGTLTYSIYLWQQPFCYAEAKSTITRLPVNLVLSMIVAVLSYYVIEKPCLRLRVRLQKHWARAAAVAG